MAIPAFFKKPWISWARCALVGVSDGTVIVSDRGLPPFAYIPSEPFL